MYIVYSISQLDQNTSKRTKEFIGKRCSINFKKSCTGGAAGGCGGGQGRVDDRTFAGQLLYSERVLDR